MVDHALIMRICGEVSEEVERAMGLYEPFHSNHEGYAALLEEVDELWDRIKAERNPKALTDGMRHEAVQVAAMAVRMIHDLVRR